MEKYLISSFIAMVIGYLLDLIFGDPDVFWHPIRLIGAIISKLEGSLYISDDAGDFKKKRRRNGALLVVFTVLAVFVSVELIRAVSYRLNPAVYVTAEAVLVWLGLAQKSLKKESMKVYDAFAENDTERARYAVSMIVGRDTKNLSPSGIMRAAVETVAENTSDGVTAPLFYCALFGSAGEYVYKAVNTMDSMIGYKNEKYMDFGRCAARLDDVLNFIPSRLSALLMICASYILGYDHKNAKKIFLRDRYKHASPNSAQTESVCAGALNIRLAGNAWYGGVLFEKEYIGDDTRPIEAPDIKRACRLMYATGALSFALAVVLRIIILAVVYI